MPQFIDPNGREAAQHVLRLRLSVDLLRRNYEELSVAVRHLTSPLIAHEMAGVDDRWHRHEAMREVLHLLHNYVAAVKSLVDHTRRVYRKLYERAGLLATYQAEVSERFANDPLSQFVENLREMAQHYRLPSVQFSTSFENLPTGPRMTHRLQLVRDDLLEYSNWSPPAKQFLSEAGEKIDLLELVEAHYAHVGAFFAWFREQQEQLHALGPAIVEWLTMHGLQSPRQEILAEVGRRVEILMSQPHDSLTFQDLHDALTPGLSIWDSRRLEWCQHDAEVWLNFALAAIDHRFTIPEELRLKLQSLINSGP